MTSGRDEYLSEKKCIDYEAETKRRYSWVSKTGGLANGGLTVRDYFAAKAMQGFMNECYDLSHEEKAKWAYILADAMMKARELDKQGEL